MILPLQKGLKFLGAWGDRCRSNMCIPVICVSCTHITSDMRIPTKMAASDMCTPVAFNKQNGASFHHHHHQSLFIHEIVSFYMVFLGTVFKTRLKYSKELLAIMLKIQKLTLWIIRVTMGHGVLEKSPMKWSFKNI